ncbi:MAG: hypothetical protein PUE72_13545 [Lachnospiraceae bacterium]|nr:hypothetical protein [Lachnospiraceae bacterium]
MTCPDGVGKVTIDGVEYQKIIAKGGNICRLTVKGNGLTRMVVVTVKTK